MNEEAAAQQYLVDYLSTDTTLMSLLEDGVFLRTTPESAKLPVVKIDRQDGHDLMVVGMSRVWSEFHYLVRGIVHWKGTGNPDWSAVQAIGDRLDVLLHRYSGSSSTLRVNSWREEPFTDETVESGELFQHCGGIYRLRAQAL